MASFKLFSQHVLKMGVPDSASWCLITEGPGTECVCVCMCVCVCVFYCICLSDGLKSYTMRLIYDLCGVCVCVSLSLSLSLSLCVWWTVLKSYTMWLIYDLCVLCVCVCSVCVCVSLSLSLLSVRWTMLKSYTMWLIYDLCVLCVCVCVFCVCVCVCLSLSLFSLCQVDYAKILHYVGAGLAFPTSMLFVSVQSALTYRLAKAQADYHMAHTRLALTMLAFISLVLSILNNSVCVCACGCVRVCVCVFLHGTLWTAVSYKGRERPEDKSDG